MIIIFAIVLISNFHKILTIKCNHFWIHFHIYKIQNIDEECLLYKEWICNQCEKEPQFHFWHQILELELLILEFVGSLRTNHTSKFKSYIQCLEHMMPWIFALDHTNYARNLPVHLRDLHNLQYSHPEIYHEFNHNERFVSHLTTAPFSGLALDQTHEQLNAEINISTLVTVLRCEYIHPGGCHLHQLTTQ